MITKKNPVKAQARAVEEKSTSPKNEEKKIVRAAQPSAKLIGKENSSKEVSKTGIRMAKKVQTAEGWKREATRQHQAKKQTK